MKSSSISMSTMSCRVVIEKDWPDPQEILGELDASVPTVPWTHLLWKPISIVLPMACHTTDLRLRAASWDKSTPLFGTERVRTSEAREIKTTVAAEGAYG